MIYQLLFIVAALGTLVVCVAAAYIAYRNPLKPFARNLLIGILITETIIAVFHLLSAQDRFPEYWNWFFDLQYERNLGAMFSSLQLMLVALVALVNGLLTPGLKLWQRLYWLLLTATFVYLSLDEFYAIHETFGGRVPSNNWEIPYAIGGIILFLISSAAFWFGFRRQWRVFAYLLVGIGILALGAVFMEKFVRDGFVENDSSLRWMFIFEEMFEMIGATVVLTGFLGYASEYLDTNRIWVAGKRFVAVGGVAWSIWLLFALLLQPALEARFLASRADIDYDNGLLTLVGYRVEPAVVRPSDEIALTLYWRANRPITTDYSVSLHVLAHPEIDSVAQSDDLHVGAIPSSAWFPGVVSSRTLYVNLPRNLPTPASYWLSLRVWSGPWPFGRPLSDTTGLLISNAGDYQLLGEDSVILASVPALPRTAPLFPVDDSGYRFTADGFELDGVVLPEAKIQTHQLTTEFWWSTTSAPTRNLTQFFHLVPQGGGDVLAFDQQPFGGSFPTSDWPANQHLTDTWTLQLPDDVPAGSYDVYTGMYDLTTMQRSAVVDQSGQALPDNSIHLGSIDYEPDAAVEAALAQATPGVCYALSDTNSMNGNEQDTLVRMNTDTGAAVEINQTGTIKTEGVALSADLTQLYVVDERDDIGLFGIIDLQTAQFTPVGSGLATEDNPARNPALHDTVLKDIDSLALERQTGILWGVLQDEENFLFQIDPATGAVVRDTFTPGYDYIKIDLSALPDYVNVKDLAIDPNSGDFYITVATEAFDGYLATIDFETLDLDAGTVQIKPLYPFTSSVDQQPIRDVEALSFTPGGTLFAISTNNSNVPANFDRLWQVDAASGAATPIGSFTDYVDFVDYEAVACLDAGSPAS